MEIFGEGDEVFETVEVHAVDDEVDGKGERGALEDGDEGELEGVGACSGDVVGGDFVDILEAELEVFEAGLDEFGEAGFGEADPGGDHVDVEAGFAGGPDELGKVFAGEGFAAGEVDVEDAELGGFAKDALPVGGG
jgi:hypothetical protein